MVRLKNMKQELTFNDLPQVVAQLLEEVMGMRAQLTELQGERKTAVKDTHVPMTVEETGAYLKMPKATLYMKLADGTIPAIKAGKRYTIYRDELDKWLEANRKNPVPMTAEEENAAVAASHRRRPKPLNIL